MTDQDINWLPKQKLFTAKAKTTFTVEKKGGDSHSAIEESEAMIKAFSMFGEVFGNCGNDPIFIGLIEAMDVPQRRALNASDLYHHPQYDPFIAALKRHTNSPFIFGTRLELFAPSRKTLFMIPRCLYRLCVVLLWKRKVFGRRGCRGDGVVDFYFTVCMYLRDDQLRL
ncbi:predicted protein [Lichtheimia corymbifera JMRC:FSU:9682]|uniref:Uncharacterized protein n=1 Tax=Lichtheimia corymbifera JMRC:FSU:9682 TaxID=1263082 RepID=A0A068S242_9FUNG|nr:predicted protein [Lichtheimia corymbifera JMRC:FSU:9682]